MKNIAMLTILLVFPLLLTSQTTQPPADKPGYFRNPIYFADYPDPDVIRIGDDFYMVVSSFTYSPGLPVYHSRNLIHWRQIANILDRHPSNFFDVPRHGHGVWAPSIRFHNGYFRVFWGDPDFGIFMSKAKDPSGPWSEPHLVRAGRGLIDPCPFWDDDGNAYLVRAYARSRAGINSILVMHRMSPDGKSLIGDGVMVFDGTREHRTIEGPKMYKREGWYYIFAPAGGVTWGWQTVLRSRNVFGPYEVRTVMHQGTTDINGPHQGGWVELESGEHWFVHFQCNLAYGRMLHLNPMRWNQDGWPSMGVDLDGDGIGEPVRTYRYPDTPFALERFPQQTSDEFDAPDKALQWRWQANWRQEWFSLTENLGMLRLFTLPVECTNLHNVSQVLTQKFPAEAFVATTLLDVSNLPPGAIAGLAATGNNYATLRVENRGGNKFLVYAERHNAHEGGNLNEKVALLLTKERVFLRMCVKPGAICSFYFSTCGGNFTRLSTGFQATRLRWVGSSIALYSIGATEEITHGSADFDWIRITYHDPNLQ